MIRLVVALTLPLQLVFCFAGTAALAGVPDRPPQMCFYDVGPSVQTIKLFTDRHDPWGGLEQALSVAKGAIACAALQKSSLKFGSYVAAADAYAKAGDIAIDLQENPSAINYLELSNKYYGDALASPHSFDDNGLQVLQAEIAINSHKLAKLRP